MKVDVSLSPFDRPGAGSPIEAAIEELVYEHLLDLVDHVRIDELERVVAARFADLARRGELPSADNGEVAKRSAALMARAWHRVLDGPRPPFGNWEPDDDCEICRAFDDARESPVVSSSPVPAVKRSRS